MTPSSCYKGGMTTEEMARKFLAYCRMRGLASKTLEYYQWVLGKLLAGCPELPTMPDQIATVLDDPKLGLVSRAALERGIRAFLTWAEDAHDHPNPLRGTKKMKKVKTLPRVLYENEVAALWAACETQQQQAMIKVLLDTGIRLDELTHLRWSDIDTDTNSIRVDGKTGPRVIPISPPVLESLQGLGDSVHVWVGSNGPMTRSAVQSAIRRLCRKAGLLGPKLGPHILRHTFGTYYIVNGGGIAHLQKIMGHASIETTMIYVHLAANHLKADHAAHSPALRLLGD